MSHKATVWAIQQRGLKPATKIVLWFLCDRHNPDFGCFPTQARLADDAEMSISALNEHLAKPQELRLIHRVRAQDPYTHKRLATRYSLNRPTFAGDQIVCIMRPYRVCLDLHGTPSLLWREGCCRWVQAGGGG